MIESLDAVVLDEGGAVDDDEPPVRIVGGGDLGASDYDLVDRTGDYPQHLSANYAASATT
ncbi:hypothetical protein ABZ807_29045 [Micromonospora sp. NPDC047548]|uniref:hypothetical protein n=1 Tax=Micromonospora sp. NPDC047548 TaxID=3155624 RepID=UPI0033D68457